MLARRAMRIIIKVSVRVVLALNNKDFKIYKNVTYRPIQGLWMPVFVDSLSERDLKSLVSTVIRLQHMTKITSFLLAGLVISTSLFASIKEEKMILMTFDGKPLTAIVGLPEGNPKAVAVILQGSGNVGADGDVSGPFLGAGYKGAPAKLSEQLAATLAEEGIATVRYSKRGVEDASELPNQTIPFLVKDAKSALELAQSRFPGAKVSILGFSEGALLAVLVATQAPVNALFLMGLPARSIDDSLKYQFSEWPLELIAKTIDRDHNGELSAAELDSYKGTKAPILNMEFKDLDADGNGTISLAKEIAPAYQGYLSVVMGMVQKPPFDKWYSSLKELAPLSESAKTLHPRAVYFYHGADDAQTRADWMLQDVPFYRGAKKLHVKVFNGLGHCFAPMEGAMGDVKTSGPIDPAVLDQLRHDFSRLY
ncbi:MAG: alpha/beta hydrolase [Deltaproteobacteria bacterium]|nr:alpha/beta hydrolase [Deltaproteobacteria bacterium]